MKVHHLHHHLRSVWRQNMLTVSPPPVNTVLQIDSVASFFRIQSPYQNLPLTVHVNTNANIHAWWACSCISPQKVLQHSAVCVTQLSGVTSNTPTHTLWHTASVCLPRDVCSPSTSICLGFLSFARFLYLWCRMTDRAKCQFISRCWFDIAAVSQQADLCQLFIRSIKSIKKGKHRGQKITVCEGERGRHSQLAHRDAARKIWGLKTCLFPMWLTSNSNPTLL